MPSPLPLSPAKTRNPRTQARIRRDVFWQIGLPLGAVLLLVLGAGVWMVLPQGAATRSPVADVSLIFLTCPASVLAILTLAVVAGLCGGVFYILKELPYWLKRVQDVMVLVVHYTQKYAARVANVFLATRANLAAGQRTTEHVWSLIDRRRHK